MVDERNKMNLESYEHLKLTLIKKNTSKVLSIELNRPDVRNAFNEKMISEITSVFREISSQHHAEEFKDLRAVVISGSGKSFCAGADLEYMKSMINFTFAKNKSEGTALHQMFEAVYSCQLPVICKIHGGAFGGALGLIAASDFCVSTADTQFCFSEVKLGLAPAVISDFVFRKCSAGHVGPYMISGLLFNAETAMSWGLIHQKTETAALDADCEKIVEAFVNAGPNAVKVAKALVREVPLMQVKNREDFLSTTISQLRINAEGQEGIKSFLEKRKPNWI